MYAQLYDPNREIGKKYGKWTIVSYIGMHRKLQQYNVECECGTKAIHVAADLRAKKSAQCTICHNRENAINNIFHGMHKDSTYKIWSAMIQRCTNRKTAFFHRYGGRGISVCLRWKHFDNFLADMGTRPPGMTLDRIDNNGNYERKNCRWVSHKVNCRNKGY